MSAHYEVELLGTELCGADVVTLRFSRPEGYSFAAGQWFRLTLHTAEGELAETFSHCSGPGDPFLEMTTRLSGSVFKRALAALATGARATITGPGGRLALPAGAERVCFITGGTGITPIRSILRDAAGTARVFDDALLLYGNRDQSCAPFAEELSALGAIGVRVVLCFEVARDSWVGERGFIDAEMVRRHVDPKDGRPFMVAGPPVMVEAIERVLDELDIEPGLRLIEHFGTATHHAV